MEENYEKYILVKKGRFHSDHVGGLSLSEIFKKWNDKSGLQRCLTEQK